MARSVRDSRLVALLFALAVGSACRANTAQGGPSATDRGAVQEIATTPPPTGPADREPEPPPPESPAEPPPPESPPSLESYPGATSFCDGRVYPQGAGGHISWESWSTPEKVDSVIDHYVRILGTANLERTATEATWRFPADQPTRTLSVEPTTASAPWNHVCDLPRGTHAIVTITNFPR